MPFINVKVAGPQLEQAQTAAIQKGITALMAEILRKEAPLTAVLVEPVAASGWSIGAETVSRAAHVDATVSAGTNTAEEKARFIAGVNDLLRDVIGPGLPVVTYTVIHDVPMDSWGYGGLTQAHRARARL
ncbi:MAG TPA: tautomerase family protein [Aliidongia sp.]|nr:tautomerase family protein [Aliidongia sp.]